LINKEESVQGERNPDLSSASSASSANGSTDSGLTADEDREIQKLIADGMEESFARAAVLDDEEVEF
jgi:hypothetical protein